DQVLLTGRERARGTEHRDAAALAAADVVEVSKASPGADTDALDREPRPERRAGAGIRRAVVARAVELGPVRTLELGAGENAVDVGRRLRRLETERAGR